MDSQFINKPFGTISTISGLIAQELESIGYSLTVLDIQTVLISDFSLYAGWQTPFVDEITLDENQVISFNDWALLEPMVRAHCDLLQAQRVEATGSLGNERFGLTVSEASQNYILSKEVMKKEAFVEQPFLI